MENDTINISLNIKNIGAFPGKEVVQFYTKKINSTIERPLQELKAFAKTKLIKSGEDTRISVKIAIKELSYWDEKINNWSIENGSYTINAGASSRNIKQTLKISI